MNYTEHVSGPVTGDVQRCTRCGKLLLGQDVRFFANVDWFPVGIRVYVTGGHVTVFPLRNVTINECPPRSRRRGVRGRLAVRYNVRTDAVIEIPARP